MQNLDFSYATKPMVQVDPIGFYVVLFFWQGILPPKKENWSDLYCVWTKTFFWYHLEEDAFFKGNVKYYWINYGQSRPLQSHTIALEGNYTATATIANTANALRQQSRPLSSKRVRENRAKRGFKRVTRMVLASLSH